MMRIAVMGTGGVGGGFGAALAKAGADVTFIARGAHLAAMQRDGLRITGGRGETHLVPTKATNDPASIGPVDLVMFCVKLWDVEAAGEAIRPLVGPATAVLPLQNGIDASERLVPILGAQAVMGGVAQISATIDAPGVIRQTGTFMRLASGELDGSISARGKNFLAWCQRAGFDATLSDLVAQVRREADGGGGIRPLQARAACHDAGFGEGFAVGHPASPVIGCFRAVAASLFGGVLKDHKCILHRVFLMQSLGCQPPLGKQSSATSTP
jgi:hypothetical protein